MMGNKLELDRPKVKYGQNKLHINTILNMQSKKKLDKVNIYLIIKINLENIFSIK